MTLFKKKKMMMLVLILALSWMGMSKPVYTESEVDSDAIYQLLDALVENVVQNTVGEARRARRENLLFAYDDYKSGYDQVFPDMLEVLEMSGVSSSHLSKIERRFDAFMKELKAWSKLQDRVIASQYVFAETVNQLSPRKIAFEIEGQPDSWWDTLFGLFSSASDKEWDYLDALIKGQQKLHEFAKVVFQKQASSDTALLNFVESAGNLKVMLTEIKSKY